MGEEEKEEEEENIDQNATTTTITTTTTIDHSNDDRDDEKQHQNNRDGDDDAMSVDTAPAPAPPTTTTTTTDNNNNNHKDVVEEEEDLEDLEAMEEEGDEGEEDDGDDGGDDDGDGDEDDEDNNDDEDNTNDENNEEEENDEENDDEKEQERGPKILAKVTNNEHIAISSSLQMTEQQRYALRKQIAAYAHICQQLLQITHEAANAVPEKNGATGKPPASVFPNTGVYRSGKARLTPSPAQFKRLEEMLAIDTTASLNISLERKIRKDESNPEDKKCETCDATKPGGPGSNWYKSKTVLNAFNCKKCNAKEQRRIVIDTNRRRF